MKKTFATLIAIIIAVAGLHAFRSMNQSKLTGKITPASGANIVWAINGKDSTRIKSANGTFALTIKPGPWKLLINAKEPLENVVLDVHVQEGKTTDLGEIKLQQ